MQDSTSRRSQAPTGAKASRQQGSGSELAPWRFLSELSRQQLAVVTESASAAYRSNEALHKIQQEIAHEASVRHAQAAEKLFSPSQPADLLAIQSKLLRTDVQCASQYWQHLATAAMQAQKEMMASISHLLENESSGETMKSALQAFQSAIPAMAMGNSFMPRPNGTHRASRGA